MEKKLSVIVPIYNVEAYLSVCIDSILDQTYKNLEVILVNDGSPDRCGEICDEYAKKDERVKVIHKENGGQGSARNRGLDIAQGEYVAFVDSDDYLDLDMYEIMIEALERTDSDIAVCGLKTHSGVRVVNSRTPEKELVIDGAKEILWHYFSTPYITGSPCDKVCKRELFSDLRYPENVAREDIYIMHFLYGKSKRAVHTGKCFYHYNIREGSSEHQEFSPKFLISIKIADDRREYIADNFPELIPLAEKACYGARLSAIKKITRSHAIKENKETYESLKEYIRTNPACTKEQETLRNKILYWPWLYALEMDINHKWRNQLKKLFISIFHPKN